MKKRVIGTALIEGTMCVKIFDVKIKTTKFRQEIPFDEVIEVEEIKEKI